MIWIINDLYVTFIIVNKCVNLSNLFFKNQQGYFMAG